MDQAVVSWGHRGVPLGNTCAVLWCEEVELSNCSVFGCQNLGDDLAQNLGHASDMTVRHLVTPEFETERRTAEIVFYTESYTAAIWDGF